MTHHNVSYVNPKWKRSQILEKISKAKEGLDQITDYLNSSEKEDAITNRIMQTSFIEVKAECDYCCQMLSDYPGLDNS